jgi:drug/metabolite transporter (DMT)-like permease
MATVNPRVIGAFAAIYLIWGSTYLAIRFAIETLPPFYMSGSRFMAAGAVLYLWARLRGAPRPEPAHWKSTAVIGGLLILGGNGGVVWAEQRVASGLAALLVATVPMWMVLLDWARRGGTHPGARVLAGLALGFGGVVVLVGQEHFGSGVRVDAMGAVALMIAAVSWAIGSLYSRSALLPQSSLLATAMEMLAGGALLMAAGAVTGETARLSLMSVSPRSLLSLAYLAVFGSLIGFSAYIWLLKVSTPAHVSTYAYVNPVIAVFLGWGIGNEQLSPFTVVAAGVIVASVAVITTGGGRAEKGATDA